jgi:hypothetical protein
VPTELGNTSLVFGPATVFRALGLLNPVSDPAAEMETLGNPPSIGFKSTEAYDFDQRDGVDSDKIDFEGLAAHEIGHILGFFSMATSKESHPGIPVAVSPFDLFRFRPGITMSQFTTAPRAHNSGGVHLFYSGGPQVQLSTGWLDGSHGDGQQSHHWKDNALSGTYLGVMDPTFDRGEHFFISDNDLMALDMMGYTIAREPEEGDAPTILQMAASLDGDVLTLTGTAADPQGDISQAQVKLLNGGGLVVAQTSPFAVNLPNTPEVSFTLTITNLRLFPLAVQALLILTDDQGQTSNSVITRFSQADPGGPTLSEATLIGKKLKIKGNGLDGNVELEINGEIVVEGFNANRKKLTAKGSAESLNLQSGFNRLRIRKDGLWSNIYLFEM